MEKNPNSLKTSLADEQGKYSKDIYKNLFEVLHTKPISRRMAATAIGYTDQTYMVTQTISDWIRDGRASVVGQIKCTRSDKWVQAITTNPELFPKPNQTKLF